MQKKTKTILSSEMSVCHPSPSVAHLLSFVFASWLEAFTNDTQCFVYCQKMFQLIVFVNGFVLKRVLGRQNCPYQYYPFVKQNTERQESE